MFATLGSTILGFAREVVTARYFGASSDLDAFLAALVVPTILFGVFNGALVSALVPIFSGYVSTSRPAEAARLACTLILSISILLAGAAVVAWFFAPYYVPLILHFPHDRLALTVNLTRLLLPMIVATSLSGIMAALLNAHRASRASALQGLVLNAAVIAGRRIRLSTLWCGDARRSARCPGYFAQLADSAAGVLVAERSALVDRSQAPRHSRSSRHARPGRDRLGGRPNRSLFRSVLCLGFERRFHLGDELRRQDRRAFRSSCSSARSRR